MDESNIVISTKAEQKISRKEIVCYIIGLISAIFLLVYPGRLLYKVFGVGILVCGGMIFFTSRKDKKTFVTVYEDGVKGVGYAAGNKLVEFELKFKEIKSVRMKETFVIIETKKGSSYKCLTGDNTNEVSLEISRRTK